MTTKLRATRHKMYELAEQHYQLGGRHADSGARNCDCELAEQFRLADHECEMLVANDRALADLDATCEDLADLDEAFERGRLHGLGEAAEMVENAVMPEAFHKTGIYTEFEQGGDNYLKDIAAAIRGKIKGAAVGEQEENTQ